MILFWYVQTNILMQVIQKQTLICNLQKKIQNLILSWSYHSDLLYIYIFLQLSTAFIWVPETTKFSLFECSWQLIGPTYGVSLKAKSQTRRPHQQGNWDNAAKNESVSNIICFILFCPVGQHSINNYQPQCSWGCSTNNFVIHSFIWSVSQSVGDPFIENIQDTVYPKPKELGSQNFEWMFTPHTNNGSMYLLLKINFWYFLPCLLYSYLYFKKKIYIFI